uniref:Uncharacterized protein n=1 Tax=Rhizophora mucronata TaxID=61149 RepID=A0A2P2J858_RHIMU
MLVSGGVGTNKKVKKKPNPRELMHGIWKEVKVVNCVLLWLFMSGL